ncbi:MAG: DUF2934 domain-containing protein [Bryobacteraceae bacterium]
MSTPGYSGTPYENHQRAAELHLDAAHHHRSAAEAHEKEDHLTGRERSQLALEYSQMVHGQAPIHSAAVNEYGMKVFGHHDIARLAHELWQARGCREGSADSDWFDAAQQLRARNSSKAE